MYFVINTLYKVVMKQINIVDSSVIIPVYNQSESLKIILNFFQYQSYPSEKYEIIIVDDGSTDDLENKINDEYWPKLECKVTYIRHEKNRGRAYSRNQGAKIAQGKCLIFCDSDRFPSRDFVKFHTERIINSKDITIVGCPWDYFGSLNNICNFKNINWDAITKYSRKTQYYKKITKICFENGLCESRIAWCLFLVGNSSLRASDFFRVGGFDSNFTDWGFEHFDIAIRLQNNGIKFSNCKDIGNYHIPHRRETGYYREKIEASTKVLINKYDCEKINHFKEFLFGEISLQEFENLYSGNLSNNLNIEEPIYYISKI